MLSRGQVLQTILAQVQRGNVSAHMSEPTIGTYVSRRVSSSQQLGTLKRAYACLLKANAEGVVEGTADIAANVRGLAGDLMQKL